MPSLDGFFASGKTNPRRLQKKPKKQEEHEENIEPQQEYTPVQEETPQEYKPAKEPKYKAQPKEGRIYPERTFDKFASKMIQVEDGNLSDIRGIADLIKVARRGQPAPKGQAKQRITENVILRNLISVFCEEYEKVESSIDYSKVTNEAEVKILIRNILKF